MSADMLLSDLGRRLIDEFPDVSPAVVDTVIHQEHARLEASRIRDFVLTARREARLPGSEPSLRWLASLTIPIMAAAVLAGSAAIATADAADDAYLAQLRAAGFTWPPDHDAALTGMGRLICDDLGWGWTYDQIAQQVHVVLDPRNVTFGDVGSMVSLAHSIYCPLQRCWAAHC